MGAGVLLLIFSWFGWLSVNTGVLGISYSWGAWHEYWWLATLLGLAVSVIFALRVLLNQPLPQIKPPFLVYGAAGGFVITLIALLEVTIGWEGAGPGFGIIVCLILAAAQTYFTWLWAQDQPGWTLPRLPGPAKK